MTNLQIPYAYTNNKIPTSPEVAEKGQDFSCPLCDCEVRFNAFLRVIIHTVELLCQKKQRSIG